ncbi:hypothetical protein PL321_04800 [Caloramator sp. mosi_1]|uniref:hypothetical protein n=1 Tax=Caloramator sp. mosi_1 TaxID=3023090 RepID=UPI00235E1420|nr:hypothetical protein [Caloramator sp. mosi_1]WDC84900.1 hypothetical protein PL321_04800 [Caloramator sp. mosi_1]
MNKTIKVLSLYIIFIVFLTMKIVIFNNIININNTLFNFISLLGVILILTFILSLFGIDNYLKYSIVFNLLISFILVANILNYTYFKDIVSIFNITSVKYLDDISSSIARNFSFKFMLIFIIDILFICLIKFIFNKSKKEILNIKYMDILTRLSVFAIIGIVLVNSTISYAKKETVQFLTSFITNI